MKDVETPPQILPVDSPSFELPIEYVRDEIIEMLSNQVESLPPNIQEGCLQGLAICEMFVSPREFQEAIDDRDRYLSTMLLVKMPLEEKKMMLDFLYATWMIKCTYAVLREYWKADSTTNVIAALYLALIYQKFMEDDCASS